MAVLVTRARGQVQTRIQHSLTWRKQSLAFAQHPLAGSKARPILGLSTLYHCGTARAEQLNGEFEMSLKKASVAAILAVSMASTPVLAQSAASLSVAAHSGATSGEDSDLRGGFLVPAIAVVAIILGILALTGGGSDPPHSP